MYSSVTSGMGLTEGTIDQEREVAASASPEIISDPLKIVALTLSSPEMFSNPLKN